MVAIKGQRGDETTGDNGQFKGTTVVWWGDVTPTTKLLRLGVAYV